MTFFQCSHILLLILVEKQVLNGGKLGFDLSDLDLKVLLSCMDLLAIFFCSWRLKIDLRSQVFEITLVVEVHTVATS